MPQTSYIVRAASADAAAAAAKLVELSAALARWKATDFAAVRAPRLPRGSALGSFSKSLGGVSINFNTSGGPHCDKQCRYHPQTKNNAPAAVRCYAERVETRPDRAQLAAKLLRHQRMPFAQVCGKATIELRQLIEAGRTPTWVRGCTNGALPRKPSALELAALRAFVKVAHDAAVFVHLPVETPEKAAMYGPALAPYAVVRESAQSLVRFLSAAGPVSYVADAGEGSTLRQRTAEARAIAKQRTAETGRKCIVCPAVLNSFATKLARAQRTADNRKLAPEQRETGPIGIENKRAKCGACVACALPLVDIVYPGH